MMTGKTNSNNNKLKELFDNGRHKMLCHCSSHNLQEAVKVSCSSNDIVT